MLFKTTDIHEELRKKVREFAESEVNPIAFMLDQNNEFPTDALNFVAISANLKDIICC